MPFISDTFTHLFDWILDPQRQEKIVNARLEAEFDGLDTGLSAVAARVTTSVATGAVDNAALRADGTGGNALQNSVLIIADTTGAVSRNGNGGIPLQGTNTNDSAAAGDVGEYVSSTIAVGSPVALTTNTPANLTSISLTAGDWDVSFNMIFSPASGTSVTNYIGGLNTTTATQPTFGSPNRIDYAAVAAVNFFLPMALPAQRFSLSGTTTVYAVATAVFTVSTMSVCGILRARRVR
jgi:hypothetical protein